MTLPPQTARGAALEALRRAELGDAFLQDHLHAVLARADLDARDRALATQLAAGVVRHRRTLRLLVSHLRGEKGRAGAIQPALLRILEVGAFQLLLLDRVPAYAAINEAVEAARRTVRPGRGRKVAGFVNALLRNLQRLVAGHDPDGRPAPDAVPHPDGGVVRLAEAVLPDPADGRTGFLGAAYSYPDWLVARWLDACGEETEAVCRWQNRRPCVFARVNPMRHTA
ncbi:MAG: transcription antitermination factor NusB, partial [Planctomycetota bacterium]|nr:transcription antitermination factor NusB [Planctomycetota bacterium]